MKKIKDYKMCKTKALEEFSKDIEKMLSEMDEFYFFVNKRDKRKYEKTYKFLDYMWEEIEKQLIYLKDEEKHM